MPYQLPDIREGRPAGRRGPRSASGPRCRSSVWFTLGQGILNEVFHPFADTASTRDLELLVTDREDFFSRETVDTTSQVSYLASGVPAFQLTNTCKQGALPHREDHPRRPMPLRGPSRDPSCPLKGIWPITPLLSCWPRTWATRGPGIVPGSPTSRATHAVRPPRWNHAGPGLFRPLAGPLRRLCRCVGRLAGRVPHKK